MVDAQGTPVTGDDGWVNPRWEYPEYPAGAVVEIRVHGVGGEPPSGMTRDPDPRNVGGDDLAGFWRARNPQVGDEPGHYREVLAWGGQTSGTIRHALWVLLLPFALFNLAGRMPGGKRRAAPHRAVARLLAFTMTLGVVALTCGIVFDLVANQYGSDAWRQGSPTAGTSALAPVKFFSDDGIDGETTADGRDIDYDPAGVVGFLALVPALVVIGLWLAGKYRTRDLEGFPPEGTAVPVEPEELDDANFWRNEWPVSRLRAAHGSGGLALVGVTLCLVLADLGPTHQEHGWTALAALAGLGVVLSAVAVTLPATAKPRPDALLRHLQWVTRLLALVPLTAAAVLAMGTHLPLLVPWLAWVVRVAGTTAVGFWVGREIRNTLATSREGATARVDAGILLNLVVVGGTALFAWTLPSVSRALNTGDTFAPLGHAPDSFAWLCDPVVGWMQTAAKYLYLPSYSVLLPLVALQVVLVLALVATGVRGRRSFPARTGGNPALDLSVPFNLGAPVVALVALLLITAVGGSLHALVIEWLGQRHENAAQGLVLPWWYALTAETVAILIPLLALAALGIRALVRWRTAPKVTPAAVAAELARGLDRRGGNPSDPVDARRLRAIGKGWHTHQLLHDATHILFWTVTTATVLVGTYLTAIAVGGDGADLVLQADGTRGRWWAELVQRSGLTSAAVALLSFATVGAVGVMRAGLRSREKRRSVAAAWDVLAFWPRVTHPFAPPCYGEAIVPMLAGRIDGLLAQEDKDYTVVVAGHSQGSVVSLAAVMQAHRRERVHLVTYGSPISALYERTFVLTFAGEDGAIRATEQRVATWHHLFGMTEPFAVPIWDVPGASVGDLRAGWPGNVAVPHADQPCPVCGWSRDATPGTRAAHHTDFVVTDPAPWQVRLDAVAPVPCGHSTYHDHREVDEHLGAIAP